MQSNNNNIGKYRNPYTSSTIKLLNYYGKCNKLYHTFVNYL